MTHLEAFIAHYGVLFVFFGTLLEGETVVIMAGFLAHQGLLDPYAVAGAAFLGSWANDQAMFYIGRHASGSRIVKKQTERPAFAKALAMIERNSTKFILAFRFLYGLRTISPLALGVSNVSAWRYLIFNTIAAATWAAVITAIGYALSGMLRGTFGELPAIEHKIAAAFVAAVLATLAIHILVRRSRRPA